MVLALFVRNYYPVWRELKPFPISWRWRKLSLCSELLSRLKGIETIKNGVTTFSRTLHRFGTTIPFEGNWNKVLSVISTAKPKVRNYYPVWRELKPRLPLTIGWLNSSELLSRLKGIETLIAGDFLFPTRCSELLSRLKGIETLESPSPPDMLTLVRNYYPVWRELKLNSIPLIHKRF